MRARYLVFVLALLGATETPAPQGGTITGTVRAVKDTKFVDKYDYAYVYLEPVTRTRRSTAPGAGTKREIVQKNKSFNPRVLVVPLGAEVSFPNSDPDIHNVFSPTDPVFDLGRYKTDKKGKSHRFDDVDEYDIFCDMHREMWAKVKVVDTPYIAQVVGGKFTLPNVAPGKYKLVAWAPNSPESRYPKEITVTAGAAIALDREVHLMLKSRSGCHDRKDGTLYDKADYNQCPKEF